MAKTTTFAVTHFSVAFAVTYALTGDLVIGGMVAMVEPAVNTVAYYFHEKVWNRISNPNRSHPNISRPNIENALLATSR